MYQNSFAALFSSITTQVLLRGIWVCIKIYSASVCIFLPKLRETLKTWVKACAHFRAYDIWITRQQELYFLWPIVCPFYIVHVDIWVPEEVLIDNGIKFMFLNVMCNLTQFVISTSLPEKKTSALLAIFFMETLLITFLSVYCSLISIYSRAFLGWERVLSKPKKSAVSHCQWLSNILATIKSKPLKKKNSFKN